MNFPCPDCAMSVSETALECPHCGKSFAAFADALPSYGGGAPPPPPPPFGAPPPSAGGSAGFGFGAPPHPAGFYAPPAAAPFRPSTSADAEKIAREALALAVTALFCFAPLCFWSLRKASEAEGLARAAGVAPPPLLRTARIVAYVGIVLWLGGIALRLASHTRR